MIQSVAEIRHRPGMRWDRSDPTATLKPLIDPGWCVAETPGKMLADTIVRAERKPKHRKLND